jgi:hypothetical protein
MTNISLNFINERKIGFGNRGTETEIGGKEERKKTRKVTEK